MCDNFYAPCPRPGEYLEERGIGCPFLVRGSVSHLSRSYITGSPMYYWIFIGIIAPLHFLYWCGPAKKKNLLTCGRQMQRLGVRALGPRVGYYSLVIFSPNLNSIYYDRFLGQEIACVLVALFRMYLFMMPSFIAEYVLPEPTPTKKNMKYLVLETMKQ